MTTAEMVALGIIALLVAGMFVCAALIERKRTRWEWLHPPEDDDGCSVMSEEDDPDGKYSC